MLIRILFSFVLMFVITAGAEAQYLEDLRYQSNQHAVTHPGAEAQESLSVDASLPAAWRGNFSRNYKILIPKQEAPHTTGTHTFHDGTGQMTKVNSPVIVKKVGNQLTIHYQYEMIVGAASNETLSRTRGHTIVITTGEAVLKGKAGELEMLTTNEVRHRSRITVNPNSTFAETMRESFARAEALADQVADMPPTPGKTRFTLLDDGRLELLADPAVGHQRRVLAPE